MKKLNSLSIFFPFWNEEKNIKNVVESAIPIAEKIAKNWEILIIDDGSTDRTLEIAKDLEKNNNNVKVISHFPNRGYGGALREGIENSKYDIIVFTDGDGQFNFKQVDKFIDRIGNNDMVIGFREKRQDNLVRHMLMDGLKIWDFTFFGFHFKDIDCGFKMFRKEAIMSLYPLRSEGAMITTEILAKAKRKKLKIAQVVVEHFPRTSGNQSGANFFVISRAVLESLILWGDMRNGRI